MFMRLMFVGLLFGLAATSTPLMAANCAMRDTVVHRLQHKYSEALSAGGFQHNAQTMIEVWSSPETGTFTVIVTNSNGVSCIVAAGTGWFQHKADPAENDTAS